MLKVKFKKILKYMVSAFLVLLLFTALVYSRWLVYVFSLARHQIYAFTRQESLAIYSQKEKLTEQEKRALELIGEVKKFGQKTFELEHSKSYEKIVDLKRDVLGYNITVTPEFSLRPLEFAFPFVGSFSYLGFFDKELALCWQRYYQEKGDDVYLSEIGAYSTLGILRDPIFSTYLSFRPKNLIDLILHEMTHEKIFFNNSVLVSEAIAVYSARQATKLFLASRYGGTDNSKNDTNGKMDRNRNKEKTVSIDHKQISTQIFKEYNVFYSLIEGYKQELNELYVKPISAPEKRQKKKEIFLKLRQHLQEESKTFKYVVWPTTLLQETLNNAVLAQIKRYSPHSIDLFDDIWQNQCNKDFPCFFKKLQGLKKCDKDFLESEIFVSGQTYQNMQACGK